MYQLVIVLSLTLGVLAAVTWLGVAQLGACPHNRVGNV
jgi:hypothetical protein